MRMLTGNEVVGSRLLLVFRKGAVLQFQLHDLIKQSGLVIPGFFVIDHTEVDEGSMSVFYVVQNSVIVLQIYK
jgi:hypothetical protein